MEEIKIRYVWKSNNGKIYTTIVPIEHLEYKGDNSFVISDGESRKIIARNLYIGLKDKNGVEVFEGDVVKYEFKTKINIEDGCTVKSEGYFIKEIQFINGAFQFRVIKQENSYFAELPSPFEYIRFLNEFYEVIGNIYQHPELLNQAKE